MESSYFLETPIGFILYNKSGKILFKELFSEDFETFEKLMIQIKEGKIHDVLIPIGEKINKLNIDNIITENNEIYQALKEITDKKIILSQDESEFKKFRTEIPKKLKQISPDMTEHKLLLFSKRLVEFISRKQIQKHGEQSDIHIKLINETFEDTLKIINIYGSRLREWYGVHFPELTDSLISDGKLFAGIVSKLGLRENINSQILQEYFNIGANYADEIEERIQNSMGSNLAEEHLNTIQNLSQKILSLIEFKENLENDLDNLLNSVAPNLKAIIGTQLTGKLISRAGSLKRLSKMPSSTIQVLGAEKALFRSLNKKNESPKHGIIFTWSHIRGSKLWQRGKISRLLAGKISICSKVDYFKGNFIGDKISAVLEKKIEEIKKKFPEPPKRKSTETKDTARKKRKQLSKSKYKKGIKKKGKRV